jgi:hypothetical protein
MMYHSRSQELQRACAAELFNYSCRAGRPYFWVIFERITSKDKKITSIIGVDSLHCSSALHCLMIPLKSHSN